MNLSNRLSKLEAATDGGGVTVMWRHHKETDDQAIARWRAEHPGQEPEELKVIIIEWSDPQPDGRPWRTSA